ncbi:MAG: ribonuclease HII [Proteobacteria bacterium]|nr:ribonuclease HII [Pseudomonadota bacterium]MDA1060144.1 ribonuclease HII [Pseudomonadota bacterium]
MNVLPQGVDIAHTGPHLRLEREAVGQIVVGVDEAGRGPLAGPVVAAAVVLDLGQIPDGIDDSKVLKEGQREALFALIQQTATVGVGVGSVEEIDRLNILQASLLAMRRAVTALAWRLGRMPDLALVDGNRSPRLACTERLIVGGDATSTSIAAASIIAKVTRDRLMVRLAEHHAGFGWEHNRGYGTAHHRLALTLLGPTPHHRRSFAPIRQTAHEQPPLSL